MIDLNEKRKNRKRELKVVATLTARGLTVQEMADQLGKSYFVLYRLYRRVADGMGDSLPPKSGRRIPRDKLKEVKRLLLSTNLTIVEIAEKLGLRSRSSIYYLRNQLLQKEEAKAGGFSFHEVKNESRRCELHGPVAVWPCVACEAERYRQANAKPSQPLLLVGHAR